MTDDSPEDRQPWAPRAEQAGILADRRERTRGALRLSRPARVGLVLLAALVVGLAAWDRVRVEQVLGELRAQRQADCLVFAPAALRPVTAETRPNEVCVIIGAAASVDRAGCREGPIRPDLDTSPGALDACLARAVGAVPPGG